MDLRIGYAQQTITPSLERPVYLAGFGQNRLAQTVHDELYARALALEHGDTRLVVVALDLIGLPRQHCQEIQRRVNAQAQDVRLLISSTHTHHGPDTIGFWGPDMTTSGVDPLYIASLKDKITQAALDALAQTRPAHLRSAALRVRGLSKNARDPKVLDQELSCLQFTRPKTGAVLATWLIYPCHPEVLWEQNPHISSDYIAPLRDKVETQTAAPCLALVGAIGGMMTPDVEEHTFDEAQLMGHALADAALGALSLRPTAPVENLEHRRQEYSLSLANPLFEMAIASGLIPNLLDEQGRLSTEANLLKIGPVWLLGVPGELLPKLGLDYKARLLQAGAKIAAIVGLTNDELGYILPQEDYVYPDNPVEPGEHYEETMSTGPDAGPRLLDALEALLMKDE